MARIPAALRDIIDRLAEGGDLLDDELREACEQLAEAGYRSDVALRRASRKSLVHIKLMPALIDSILGQYADAKGVDEGLIGPFLQKLRERGIANPSTAVLSRINMNYIGGMRNAVQPGMSAQMAEDLYYLVASLPGSATRRRIDEHYHIRLGGAWHDNSSILLGLDTDTNKLVSAKILLTMSDKQRSSLTAEEQAIRVLGLDTGTTPDCLVPSKLLTIDVPGSDQRFVCAGAGPRFAVVVPHYAVSLDRVPQCTEGVILQGAKRMRKTLCYMHDRKLIHMDVKMDNILVTSRGQWCLGDYGCCTAEGDPVWAYTQAHYPDKIIGEPAAPKHDWGMLVVALAMAVEVDRSQDLRAATVWGEVVSKVKVVARCCQVQDPVLRGFLQDLICLAEFQ